MKEIFIDEWVYRPRTANKGNNQKNKLNLYMRTPLEAFQLYVVKIFKVVKSDKDDYDDFMKLMRNFSPADRKRVLKYVGKFAPGGNKIKNIRLGEE